MRTGRASEFAGLADAWQAALWHRALLTRRWREDLPAPCRAHTRRLLAQHLLGDVSEAYLALRRAASTERLSAY